MSLKALSILTFLPLAAAFLLLSGCGGQREKLPGHTYWEDSPGAVSRLEPVGPRWSSSNFNAWPGKTFDEFMRSHPFKEAAKQGISINRQEALWEKYGGDRYIRGVAIWPRKPAKMQNGEMTQTINQKSGQYQGMLTEFRLILVQEVLDSYVASGGNKAQLIDVMRVAFYEAMNKQWIGGLDSYSTAISPGESMKIYEMKHIFAYNCAAAVVTEISSKTGLLKDPNWVERVYVDPDYSHEPFTNEAYANRINYRKSRMMTNPGDIGPEPILITAEAMEHFRAWSKANPNDWTGKPSNRDDTFTYEIK